MWAPVAGAQYAGGHSAPLPRLADPNGKKHYVYTATHLNDTDLHGYT
jgi:hypothetical protein